MSGNEGPFEDPSGPFRAPKDPFHAPPGQSGSAKDNEIAPPSPTPVASSGSGTPPPVVTPPPTSTSFPTIQPSRGIGLGTAISIFVMIVVLGGIAASGWFVYRVVTNATDQVTEHIPSFPGSEDFTFEPTPQAQKAFVKAFRRMFAGSPLAQAGDAAIISLGRAYCVADQAGVEYQVRDSLVNAGLGTPKNWRDFRKIAANFCASG